MIMDYRQQGQGQFFPGFPGGGGGINNRLDRLERQIERLDRESTNKTAVWIVLKEDLDYVKILNTLNTTIKYMLKGSPQGRPFYYILRCNFCFTLSTLDPNKKFTNFDFKPKYP